MFSTSIFHLALLATGAATASATSAIGEQTEAGLPYTLGKPTFFGSGCPTDTVAVVSSSDAKTISVLFSDFGSKTTSSRMRQYKACSLAVPLDVKPGYTVAISQVDYRGNAYVPKDAGSQATFTAEYFLAAEQGPQYTRSFTSGFNGDIFVSDPVATVKYAPCGASTVFRVNANVVAQKTDADAGDVQIAIDTADAKQGGFRYKVEYKAC